MIAKLEEAIQRLDKGQKNPAIKKLQDFINQVDALIGTGRFQPGHGDPRPKSHLAFFRGYLTDLIDAVKKASAAGATLDEMKTKIGDQLAPKYEAGMSKYPLGRYRDRVGQNVEMVHKKVVTKS